MQMFQRPVQHQRMRQRLRSLLFDYDFEAAELFAGLGAFLWGAILLVPGWDTFSTGPQYSAMAGLAPEWAWGTLMILAGTVSLMALLLDVPGWRKGALVALGAAWAAVAWQFTSGNAAAAGNALYWIMPLMAIWSFARLVIMYR